jgi:predicted enzyme related to lactoylglutathione lyase
VKFHGVEQRVMRSSQRSWDTGGIFDVDVFSTDATGAYRKLQRHGWTALGEPADYTEGNFNSREVVAVGPDGFMLAIIQRYSPPVPAPLATQLISPVFNSSQMVRDLHGATEFYTQVLGWRPLATMEITNAVEPGADVIGLPMPDARTAARRIAIVHPQGLGASVELIENGTMHGRDFSATCAVPNVGILCLRIPVPNAATYAAEIEMRGGKLYASPKKFDLAPYGPITQFSVRTPEGAILEFFDAPFENLRA